MRNPYKAAAGRAGNRARVAIFMLVAPYLFIGAFLAAPFVLAYAYFNNRLHEFSGFGTILVVGIVVLLDSSNKKPTASRKISKRNGVSKR